MDCSFFDEIIRLPGAYAFASTAEAASHYSAAQALFQQSVKFLDSLPLQKGDRVLDIGAGYGFHCAYFAQRGCRVIGLASHVSDDLQRHAQENGYEYRQSDMHALDFEAASFDWVWSHHSLEHSHIPLGALREWYRVLQPHGHLAISVPPHKSDIVSGHFHTGWSVGQLLYLLGVSGYELRGGVFLEEGYNVRAVVTRPPVEFPPTGASWLWQIKDRLPAALQPHLREQPGSLGKWNFPGRIQFLNDEQCLMLDASPSPQSPAVSTPAPHLKPVASVAGPRNQIFVTLDSLRWDVFAEADVPFLKGLGEWKKAYTQATFTYPAHMSFFAGKLPQTDDNTDFYDSVAFRVSDQGGLSRRQQLYRLDNPEAPRAANVTLAGKNIVEGFKRLGYATVGSGAVSWFNPILPAGKVLTEGFEHYAFFDGPRHACHASARKQVEWAQQTLEAINRPYFLFLNFGETHHRFVYEGCSWFDAPFNYGDATECRRRQRACLEYLDGQISQLLQGLRNYDLVICSDHGEAFGEQGLWGHGFYHPSVMEVPMLIHFAPTTAAV